MKDSSARDRVLDAVLTLFAEKGYHETSTQDMAEAAGFTKGGLYHYISSKEEALFAIHRQAMELFNQAAEGVVRQHPDDPAAALKGLILEHINTVERNHREIRVSMEGLRCLGGEHRVLIEKSRDTYLGHFEKVLARGMGEGVFRRGDPRLMALFILGAINWVHTWYKPEGKLSAPEIGDLFADYVINGLKA